MNLFPTSFARGFDRGKALVCAQAAELAYQDARTVEAVARLSQARRFEFIECRETDTQCFVAGNDEAVVVAFRGTSDWRDVLTDCRIGRVGWELGGEVHGGCQMALESVAVRADWAVRRFCDRGQALFVTGHSLGGGLATLAAVRGWPGLAGVYTFGSPRVGDRAFAAHYESVCGGRSWRVVNGVDPIPWLPGVLIGYRHVGTEVFLAGDGRVLVGPSWGQKVPAFLREAWRCLRSGRRSGALWLGLGLAGEVPGCHLIRRYVGEMEGVGGDGRERKEIPEFRVTKGLGNGTGPLGAESELPMSCTCRGRMLKRRPPGEAIGEGRHRLVKVNAQEGQAGTIN